MPQIERQYSGIRQVLLPHSSTIIIKLGTRPTILPLGSSVENKRPTRRRWWWSIGPHQLQEMEKIHGWIYYNQHFFCCLFAHFKKMIFLINPCRMSWCINFYPHSKYYSGWMAKSGIPGIQTKLKSIRIGR